MQTMKFPAERQMYETTTFITRSQAKSCHGARGDLKGTLLSLFTAVQIVSKHNDKDM